MSKKNIYQLALNSVLIALCAVLGYFSLDLFTFKFSFEGLPVLIGALMFGPIDGMIIGGLGTLLNQMLRYGLEASTMLWVLPFVVSGLFVGMVVKARKDHYGSIDMKITIATNELLLTACNTISLMIYFQFLCDGYNALSVIPMLLPRIVVCVVKAIAYCFIVPQIIRALKAISGRLENTNTPHVN